MNYKNNYKYDFKTKTQKSNVLTEKISKNLVMKISKLKNEPKWMLDLRLKSLETFLKMDQPSFGPSLNEIDFDEYKYYSSPESKIKNDWINVEPELRETFKKTGIIDAEKNFLGGSLGQFDSEAIYKKISKELQEEGIIFSNIETAIQTHPEIVKNYFGKLVHYSDNKYAALNTALWSGGSFIYVPKNVKIKKPLQSYFRINTEGLGQFERTLIIMEENSELHYIEGCTAPIYNSKNLHAAVVEVFVGDYSKCQYSTIQNWPKNVFNLVTKRAKVLTHGSMVWIDGNIGSYINMKYPSSILYGDFASSDYISIASASKGVIQDTGSKMIHIGKNTKSKILSKSISMNGGINIFRGMVKILKSATNSKSLVQCDSLITDKISQSDAFPSEIVLNNSSGIDHEAKIFAISIEEIYYLMSKGISKEKCEELIILGFANDFDKELPMEYAVEFNQLLKTDIETDESF